MRAGRVVLLAGMLAGWLTLDGHAGAAEEPAEVRVLSGPGAVTTVTVRTRPDVALEDRTPGARIVAESQGPASTGQTFTDEITLVVRGFEVSRPAAVDVADPLVSVVRLFPEAGGTIVTVFVRQPVTYSVSRPSALGEIQIALRARGRPAVAAAPRPGRPAGASEQEVAVDAESLSYDQQSDTLTARGGVTLTRGDTTLTADEVVYDRTNGVAEARGNVVLTDVQGVVRGDYAHLELDAETGWVDRADADLPAGGYFLEAGRLEKLGGPRYRIGDGIFTTCECGGLDRPTWSIASGRTDVRLEGTGLARDVTFRVKDVPVFWAPLLLFPVNTQRASGFLIPRVGYSNRRGFQYEQPFFWAIDKSQDATIGLDVETEARIGLTAEYRYAWSRLSRGAFVGGYWNEQIRGQTRGTVDTGGQPADIPENRWAIAGQHRSPFIGKSKLFLDVLAVSDDNLPREIDNFAFSGRNDVAFRTLRYTTTRAGVYRGWQQGFARFETDYYQDLIDPQELALQRLPRLEAEHAIPLLGNRLVGRLAGEAVYWERQEGFEGLRGDLAPELFLPFRLGQVLNGSIKGQVRETAYWLANGDQVAYVVPAPGVPVYPSFRVAPELERLDTTHSREIAEVRARTGTEIARVFDFRHLGLDKLRHTIEPELRWLYVPQVGRDVENLALPPCSGAPGERLGVTCSATLFAEGYLFDDRDAINRRNFLSWGLTTRLLARPAASAAPAPEPTQEPSGPEASAAPQPQVAQGLGDALGDDGEADTIAQGLSADAIPPPRHAVAPGTVAPARELVRASILHGYDVSRELVGDSHLSDVDLGLKVTPFDWLGLTYNTTFNASDAILRGMATGVLVREPFFVPGPRGLQSPTTVGVSYRLVEQDVNQTSDPASALVSTPGVNEVDASVYLRLGAYLGFTFLMRYDLNRTPQPTGAVSEPHFLERDYFVRLISACNCWVLEAGLADKTNPDERLFRVQFTLIGLGSFGKSPFNANYVGLPGISGLSGLTRGTGPGPAGRY